MKKFNLRSILKSALGVAAFVIAGSVNAQSVRVQLIHNAPAPSLDVVDVYVNDTKLEDVAFRTATGLLTLPAGTYNININDRLSADSGDLVLARFTTVVGAAANSYQVIMITGVDTPANYAANPDAVATDLALVTKRNVTLNISNQVSANVIHGTPDGATVSVRSRGTAVAFENLKYNDTTTSAFIPATSHFIDVVSGGNIVKSYIANLTPQNRKALTFFASGFMDPSANQNGPAFGLFAADSSGNILSFSEGSRVQVINTSAHPTSQTVDVYFNDVRVADNLQFRKATAMMSVPSGPVTITVSLSTSTDSSSASALYKVNAALTNGKTAVVFVEGLANTSGYAPNPEAITVSLAVQATEAYAESTTAGDFGYLFYNAVTDLEGVDFVRTTPAPQTIAADNISFNGVTPLIITPAASSNFQLTDNSGTNILGSFSLDLSTKTGATGVIFVSGFKDTAVNATKIKWMVHVAYTDGTVSPITEIVSSLQLVNNSSDPANATVDVYFNGTLAVNDLGFRKATAFLSLVPDILYTIAVAPSTSTSAADAFYTTTLTPLPGKKYYAIATGLKTPASFAANPQGRNTAFKLATYADARTVATVDKNVDLLFYHGSTDMTMVNIRGEVQPQFIARNNVYDEFHGYAIYASLDNQKINFMDATKNDSIFHTRYVSLSTHKGIAGLAFLSGFYDTAQANQKDSPWELLIAWPDGDIDTFDYLRPTPTGVKENVLSKYNVVTYPNPAKESVTVSFELHATQTTGVEVFDITGKKVAAVAPAMTGAGRNEIKVDVSSMKPGVYFMGISIDGQKGYQKFTVIE